MMERALKIVHHLKLWKDKEDFVKPNSTSYGNTEFEIKPKTASGARTAFTPVKWQDNEMNNKEQDAARAIRNQNRKVAVIMGAGDGLGSAIAKKFANKGMIAIVARRNGNDLIPLLKEIHKRDNNMAFGYSIDARNETEIVNFISYVENEFGRISFACYNIGANVNFSIDNTTSRVFFKVWEMACFGAFLFGKEVSKHMLKYDNPKGTIIFTGATASIRGNAGFAAFSAAKAGTRMIAQSMHRELSSKGIHIAHIIVDGAIEGKFIQSLRRDKKIDKFPFTIMSPDNIAQNFWMIYKQPKDAWTFEMDLRPFDEKHTS